MFESVPISKKSGKPSLYTCKHYLVVTLTSIKYSDNWSLINILL